MTCGLISWIFSLLFFLIGCSSPLQFKQRSTAWQSLGCVEFINHGMSGSDFYALQTQAEFSGIPMRSDTISCKKVIVTDLYMRSEPIAFGVDGQVHRKRLYMSLMYQIADKNRQLQLTRDFRVNPDEPLSSDEEARITTMELQQNLFNFFYERLPYELSEYSSDA